MLQRVGQLCTGKPSQKGLTCACRAHHDPVAFAPEHDLVAGLDAQLVAKILGYDDLPFGPTR